MASLEEMYGSDHEERDNQKRAMHIVDTMASTLAEMMELRVDTTVLWKDKHLIPEYRDYLIKRIHEFNPKIFLAYADCDTMQSMPYFIRLPLVEYFIMINANTKKQYCVFVSPDQIGVM